VIAHQTPAAAMYWTRSKPRADAERVLVVVSAFAVMAVGMIFAASYLMDRAPVAQAFTDSVPVGAQELASSGVAPTADSIIAMLVETARVSGEIGTEGGASGSLRRFPVLSVQGILFSTAPEASLAILRADGGPVRSLRIGDEVTLGVWVDEISAAWVTLSDGSRRHSYQLGSNPSRAGTRIASQSHITVPNRVLATRSNGVTDVDHERMAMAATLPPHSSIGPLVARRLRDPEVVRAVVSSRQVP